MSTKVSAVVRLAAAFLRRTVVEQARKLPSIPALIRVLDGIPLIKKSTLAACALAVAGLLGASSVANAVTYTLTNVPLSDGGFLNGSFTIEFGGLFDYNLTTSGGSGPPESYFKVSGFPPPAGEAIPFGTPTVVEFFPNSYPADLAYAAELQLAFTGDLNGVASLITGIGGPSWECINSFVCPSSGNLDGFSVRFVEAGGEVSETPLPTAWLLLLGGLAGFSFFGYRRTKNGPAFAAVA